jgi:hypothetical protein
MSSVYPWTAGSQWKNLETMGGVRAAWPCKIRHGTWNADYEHKQFQQPHARGRKPWGSLTSFQGVPCGCFFPATHGSTHAPIPAQGTS